MRILCLGVLLSISMGALLAQPADIRPDIPPEIDEKTLSESLASGANYYSFVPLHSGKSTLLIHNQSQFPNDILVVSDRGKEMRKSRVLSLKPFGTYHLPAGSLAQVDRLYFLSIQPFQVESEKPLAVFGMKTKKFNTLSPNRQLELLSVDNLLGKRLMVGVTPDGDVHHPVYGMKIGVMSREESSVFLYRGGSMQIQPN